MGKEYEEKQEEAKKLAKMNAEEKLKHQLEQKESEINELKRQQTLTEMSKEASKMLSENELPFDDDLLSLLVSDDAEATKKPRTQLSLLLRKSRNKMLVKLHQARADSLQLASIQKDCS
ncbi:capsid assembly scaffolding protein Gp46 family protein [Enterococcus avium]|uniref:capsid assembly scaffolding protein Gp46 family protein n=1 Tax=Enterococcus avium TaxID=33945 RepID=UPI003704C90A